MKQTLLTAPDLAQRLGLHAAQARGLVQALLRGISPRSEVTHRNWTALMAERLRRNSLGSTPPFHCSRGVEAVTYASLPTPARCIPAASTPHTHT